ncbi:hypothetical protein CEXT_643031 [Caerostris extrusa]|uniref:Uncharacterized protein n=1 Tax=Caerostris extrusa TaxID=172846 RepID=A0AAV4XQ07_CAEEX|nr:hypothetical protein CEXT_643031 [Caerostris extrusa]
MRQPRAFEASKNIPRQPHCTPRGRSEKSKIFSLFEWPSIIRGPAYYTFEMFETCRFRRKGFRLPLWRDPIRALPNGSPWSVRSFENIPSSTLTAPHGTGVSSTDVLPPCHDRYPLLVAAAPPSSILFILFLRSRSEKSKIFLCLRASHYSGPAY